MHVITDEFLVQHFDELEQIRLNLSGVEALALISASLDEPICQKIKAQIHRRIAQMVGIRIEGTEQEIKEVLRRFNHIFDTVTSSSERFYDSRRATEKLYYCRTYWFSKASLLDQLEAVQITVRDLEAQNGELLLEIERLREQLRIMPQPQPHDAVLGGK